MIEVAIMIEGQNGLNWPRWQKIAKLVEELGFVGLYRSDHYTNSNPPDMDSLELWTSLTWLASHTTRIEFGPMVSPVSFRDPTMTARMASAVDDLSGGRLYLGMGAGWQAREHTNFGWDLLGVRERFDRFEEGLEVVTRLIRSEDSVSFSGHYYNIQDAILLPRPARPGGPPILIGGNGPKLTLPLVAKYATEWNAVYLPPEKLVELNAMLDQLLISQNRLPADVRRSLMTGLYFGNNTKEVQERATSRNTTVEAIQARGVVFGTANQIVHQLGEIAQAGMYRVMLQWLDLDDLDRLEAFAHAVLPQLR
ncbi:MAG: TIGR03560 family F420-dependent LLM class oxidoreductase [Anaerolineae bacterium]|nr:TIGR03560 family F420-dependent LLM class oxidoreductase [Anaerolineae bacterium]